MTDGEILFRPNTPPHECRPPAVGAEPLGTVWQCTPCGRRYRRASIQDDGGECWQRWQRCQRVRAWVDEYPHWAFIVFCVVALIVAMLGTILVGIPAPP